MRTSIRPGVFWPTFLVLMAAVVASYVDLDAFLAGTSALNSTILDHFSWLFSLGSLYLLLLAVVVYVSPLGRIRIGGEQATRLLSPLRWFSITLCTTLAVGVLFWTTAEPLYHLMGPPGLQRTRGGLSGCRAVLDVDHVSALGLHALRDLRGAGANLRPGVL